MTDPIRIRLATDADADREVVTRIFDSANPAWATSAAEYRHGPKPAPTNGVVLLAELGGQPVGAARANEAVDGLVPRPGSFSARVAVMPTTEGQGVGRRLWETLQQWLEPQHPQEISSWADRDSHRSVAIASKWKFERRPGSIEDPADLAGDEPWALEYELRLDHAEAGDVSLPSRPPDGVDLSPLEEVLGDPALCASLYEGHEECRRDIPAWEPYEGTPLADFVSAQRARLADGGAGVVAHRGHDVLAATFADRAKFVPVIHNDFTMVRRHARGQRLALTIKTRLLGNLARARIERATTEVRTDNHPMLAVNRTLGFRPIAMRLLVRNGDGHTSELM